MINGTMLNYLGGGTRNGQATLSDFLQGRVIINERHLISLKALILNGVRASWKKTAINNLTLNSLYNKAPKSIYERVIFHPDGRCEYVAGQDYSSEIRALRTLIIS